LASSRIGAGQGHLRPGLRSRRRQAQRVSRRCPKGVRRVPTRPREGTRRRRAGKRAAEKKKKKKTRLTDGNSGFTPAFREVLLCVLLVFASWSMPLSAALVATLVWRQQERERSAIATRGFKVLTRKNLLRRLQRLIRHLKKKRSISTRKTKRMTKARGDKAAAMYASCEAFADQWHNYINFNGVPPPDAIYNVDETRLTVSQDGKVTQKRIVRHGQERAQRRDIPDSVDGSMLTFISASGMRALDVMCFRAQQGPDGVLTVNIDLPNLDARLRDRRGAVPLYYCFSKSGYFSGDQFAAICDLFADVLARGGVGDGSTPSVRAHLFCDNLAAHKTPRLLAHMVTRNVLMWSLPPNTSHFTQPLDAEAFATFKAMLERIRSQMVLDQLLAGVEFQSTVVHAAHDALAYLTPGVVKKSFETTGLFPFVKEEFLARCRAQIYGAAAPDEAEVATVASAAANLITAIKDDAVERVASIKKNTVNVRAKVSQNSVVSSLEVVQLSVVNHELNMHEAAVIKHAKAVKEHSKEKAVAAKVCRSPGCGLRCAGGSTWWKCSCGSFVACPKHKNSRSVTLSFMQHKATDCAHKVLLPVVGAEVADDAAAGRCAICRLAVDDDSRLQCTIPACKLVFHGRCLSLPADAVEVAASGGDLRCGHSAHCQFAAPAPSFLPSQQPLPSSPAPPVAPTPHAIADSFYSKNNVRRVQALAPEAVERLQAATPNDRKKYGVYAVGSVSRSKRAAPAAAADLDEYVTPVRAKRKSQAVGAVVPVKVAAARKKKRAAVAVVQDEAPPLADAAPPAKRSLNAQWNAVYAGHALESRRRVARKSEAYEYSI
jgi:hypothetical protein